MADQISRFPYKASHARFYDHAAVQTLALARLNMSPSATHSVRPCFYRGSMAGLPVPLPRFADVLTDACARLADVVCYSFIVEDLHLLLLAVSRPAV